MQTLKIYNLYLMDPHQRQKEMLSGFTREYTAPSINVVTYSFERLDYGSHSPITIHDFQRIKSNEVNEDNQFSFPDEYGKQLSLKKILATTYREQYLIDLIIHLYFHLLSPHLIIDLIHDFLLIKSSGNLEIEFIVLENLEKFVLKNSNYIFDPSRINHEWLRRESTIEIRNRINNLVSLHDFTICMLWQTFTSLQMLTKFNLSKIIDLVRIELKKISNYSNKKMYFMQENFTANLESSFCWLYNIDDLTELCTYWSDSNQWDSISTAFSNKALLNQNFL